MCAATLGLSSCGKEAPEDWTTSPGVTVTATPVVEDGKHFLNIIYENFGQDTVRKIKYELITTQQGKVDTTTKEIDPPTLFRPKDRHLVPRAIGEKEANYDEVHVGKVWVVKTNATAAAK